MHDNLPNILTIQTHEIYGGRTCEMHDEAPFLLLLRRLGCIRGRQQATSTAVPSAQWELILGKGELDQVRGRGATVPWWC